MSTEEGFLEVEDDEEQEMPVMLDHLKKRCERLQRKNKTTINKFLGKERRANSVVIFPKYYGELLTWALQRYIEKEGWNIVRTLSYHAPKPVFVDVHTDCDKCENLLMDGQLLVEKGDIRLIVTIDANMQWKNSVQVEGLAKARKKVEEFVDSVKNIGREQNFYRGKKIEFKGRIHFLNVKDRSWDSIMLDPAVKREVKANTTEFLSNSKRWVEYGIPSKRGVLLAGEPGTGKTIICRALMAEARGITCIATNAYALSCDEYITELYEMAEDLSPCIVFIEDIDLIGMNRIEYNYQHGPAMLSLLSVLDGVEEKREIVTVATTNNLEILDKAISQRPSRFDRVIKLYLPSLEQRKELVELLCKKIPIDEPNQEYIARRTERCTPAQLQEIVYSLAIEHLGEHHSSGSQHLKLSMNDVDYAISRINGRNKHQIGFKMSGENNGYQMGYAEAAK